MTDQEKVHSSLWNLVLMPAAITLAITLLRLYGELQQWPSPWFNRTAGGGGAIVGISWLPFIFGPYFAVKLGQSNGRLVGKAKTILFGLLGFVLSIGGAILAFSPPYGLFKLAGGVILVVIAILLQFIAWPSFARTLLGYAYAARIPVALVMFVAIQRNWGTHYDVLPPGYRGPTGFWSVYTYIGLIPQLVFWVGFTVGAGAFAGGIAAAVSRRRAPSVLRADA